MEYILIWLGCGVLSAIVASGKDRSVLGWFVIGFIFGPFGFIASLVVSKPTTSSNSSEQTFSPAPNTTRPRNVSEDDEEKLLTKHGIVKNRETDGSFTYKVNGRSLKFLDMAIRVAEKGSQTKEPQYKQCPFCAEDIRLEAKICRFCDRDVNTSN